MKHNYHVIIDGTDGVYNCNVKSLKSAKAKIKRFERTYPYTIKTAVIYQNHSEIERVIDIDGEQVK